ncbi:outer membrane beta-barrel protein [Flavobacterium sp. I3-2]|uniref:outer membrane beta-barrel protein n=1 Tax=Flavobacterium sp. I3-2 TaxID=2748319 RepID=UPI0015A82C64|nr:outer membrane beta-barrel protein [Flavobacterium sp. I3-2]
MNKKIIVIALLTAFSAKSQVHEKNDVEISVLVGLASSDFYGAPSASEFDPIYTPTFGINADYYANNRWSLRFGIEYRTFGAKIENFDGYFNRVTENKNKLNYIFVPIHANWHFGKNRNWNLNFGPSVSFLESSTFNGTKTGTDNLSKVHLGLGLGIGYKFVLSEKISIGIEHQEYMSFMGILKKEPYNSYYGNIGASFNVRFIYNLNSKKQIE